MEGTLEIKLSWIVEYNLFTFKYDKIKSFLEMSIRDHLAHSDILHC